jgi:hypothetical protein
MEIKMNLNRTLTALIAMMILPAVALAQPTPPPITPAPGTANIAVASFFTDGNPDATVVVSLTCTTGSISPASATLSDGGGQIFVVSNIPIGVDNACTLTQTVANDYDTSYLCDPTADIAGDVQCGNPGALSSTSCSWADVTADNVGYCAIYNDPAPVEFAVSKVWDVSNVGGGDYVDTSADFKITCDSEIVNGYDDDGEWYVWKYINGDATVTVNVIPNYEGSECWVSEPDVDSAVEVTNGCVSVDIELGQDASCTITNTVFFEGIPTLNQYGMAIMALLMLGVGFVGFRRFV